MLRRFLGIEGEGDSFYPEDWISSFIEAKNREYVPGEGITRVMTEAGSVPITDAVTPSMLGAGRDRSGVLIKLLDAGERLGIQVHPDRAFAGRVFGAPYGKTECWHILGVRPGTEAAVYIGFREYVTPELWRDLFERQDIDGMLSALHRFEVRPGDTVLVTGGTPHAIGEGCFLMEIQEPTDYTMRVERVSPAGETMTPMQLHYGAGEKALLECFSYIPRSREETKSRVFLTPKRDAREKDLIHLVTYGDTPCFRLDKLENASLTLDSETFVTAVVTEEGGAMECGGSTVPLHRGDAYFIPAGTRTAFHRATALLCYPPERPI